MKKLFKYISMIFATVFVGFFIYSNLEPKPLHATAPSIDFLLFEVESNNRNMDSLKNQIAKIKGVSTCSYSEVSNRLSIIFFPEKIDKGIILSVLKREEISFKTPEFTGDAAVQCPVPHNYIALFQKIKYALSFR